MNEYKKKLAAMQAGQVNKESSAPEAPAAINGIPNSVLLSVFEGRSKATSQMMGHRVNLAESINAKMQQAFGMDISGLRIYRSEAMKGTGMHGMAQGNKIVLGSDVNLNTTEGQAILGHEISHIRAQSQGVGMGHGGLYKNAALEHQADVEGMRAARGRPIYESNMVFSDGVKYGLGMKGVEGLSPMSPGLGATAAAPMQANKEDKARDKMMKQVKSGEVKLDNEQAVFQDEGEPELTEEEFQQFLQGLKNGDIEDSDEPDDVERFYGGDENLTFLPGFDYEAPGKETGKTHTKQAKTGKKKGTGDKSKLSRLSRLILESDEQ